MGNTRVKTETFSVKKTYFQIGILGVLVHLSQAIVFFVLDCPIPTNYNIFSALFYLVMLLLIHKNYLRIVVTSVHIEVILFATICVLSCGWNSGISLYLLAISALVYFCPFKHKYIPYIFSLTELIVYIVIKWYTSQHPPLYTHLSEQALLANYIYSAIGCFSIILFAAFSSNISATVTNKKLQQENETLLDIANYDFLTGLMSRRAFLMRAKSQPYDTPIIMAMGDVDNFKHLNDTYGHSAGDIVLQTIGNLIVTHCSLQTISCRWGGEEFLFMLTNHDMISAQRELQQLSDAISSHTFLFEDTPVHITITLGMAMGTAKEIESTLINQADSRLYEGKRTGKNKIVYE